MSFNTALSGLNAASMDLNVTGNNIANVGTTGFKSSRTEFADLYASSMLGTGRIAVGNGVVTQAVSQQFTQGNLSTTGRSLDLAVSGNGFFMTSDNGSRVYTRNGTFNTDASGYIVDGSGNRLQGYGVNANGNIVNGVITDLKVDTANQPPSPTSTITSTLSLNSNATTPTTTPFDATDSDSYNWSTSVDIYDSQGNSHTMTNYFVKDSANNWSMYTLVDGRNPQTPTSTTPLSSDITFNSAGQLTGITSTGMTVNADKTLTLTGWTPAAVTNSTTSPVTWGANGAAGATGGISIDLTKTTQTNGSFAVTAVTQDGYATGQMSGLSFAEDGQMYATYTNGQSKVIGQVILANFANTQGLTPVGNTGWKQSLASGEAVIGTPTSGTLGSVGSGTLEDSNVDLTAQLVNLIVAQRNYQANAKTVQTESTISDTIINLR
ncbi:flagellar hook protein FlgE [Pseudomonas nicosulfuronedens]|uniref:Flagellar hook protein FlgE n=1 Tax=Pseudomonas nicosulfuronedens TaxID=2571105 RepID=A0A5R9RAS2_9PSED|nr:flagellar hook protein FlgE [Pseudomonas nicosulfuronedens]MDH1010627.1 flagellar hook protein FlgE [Pseudomonas nicosulfuronedens]MDH1979721.1 flagellar hook protein FlgE [Pseudomonas nicosulfuronedens]MDH2028156.1 flagellar hook protein FlgE [Pseudomonas nicosulfuronedens]TLX80227.1 flagellar hook protein FlgE [Pseudomonas nicosulfuronedens]